MKETEINEKNKYLHFVRQACTVTTETIKDNNNNNNNNNNNLFT